MTLETGSLDSNSRTGLLFVPLMFVTPLNSSSKFYVHFPAMRYPLLPPRAFANDGRWCSWCARRSSTRSLSLLSDSSDTRERIRICFSASVFIFQKLADAFRLDEAS